MKARWTWVGSLLLALLVVAGCKNKKSDHAGGKKSMEHPGQEASRPGSDKKPAAAGEQTTCPVMGGKIVKSVYGDHMGKRVYFCCEGCIGKFDKEPMKYIKQLEDKGVVLTETPS